MDNLESLIKQGILWEDEFVDTYLKIIKNPEYMEFFGDQKEEARRLLDVMISESEEHKRSLEKLFGDLN